MLSQDISFVPLSHHIPVVVDYHDNGCDKVQSQIYVHDGEGTLAHRAAKAVLAAEVAQQKALAAARLAFREAEATGQTLAAAKAQVGAQSYILFLQVAYGIAL